MGTRPSEPVGHMRRVGPTLTWFYDGECVTRAEMDLERVLDEIEYMVEQSC